MRHYVLKKIDIIAVVELRNAEFQLTLSNGGAVN
jgi:hypothetical protein